jgi:alanine racemase
VTAASVSPNGKARATANDDATALAILTIDLASIAGNWRHLRDLSAPAECAAVVKADAYGLGMAEVAPVLARAGCRTFFVATPAEGIALRALLPDAIIYAFDGLIAGTADIFRAHSLRPVLNSAEEIAEWSAACAGWRQRLPAAIHIDSGMNRLGLSAGEIETLEAEFFEPFELALVLSHLACADEPEHAKSASQRQAFDALRRRLPAAPASLANSAGILLGGDFHYDLVRPGIALYGGRARQRGDNPMQPVVTLAARILQVRRAPAGETVGYGATRILRRPSRIAVLAVGYADGIFRTLSAGDGVDGLRVYLGAHAAPVLGRVSMDLITIDVTDVPEQLARRGAFVELIGARSAAHVLAAHAGTIDYEVLTNLGRRAIRRYIGD